MQVNCVTVLPCRVSPRHTESFPSRLPHRALTRKTAPQHVEPCPACPATPGQEESRRTSPSLP